MADANIKNLYRSIVALGRRYGAQKLVLFGSRARETTGRQVILTWPCTACRKTSAALLGLPVRNCPPC